MWLLKSWVGSDFGALQEMKYMPDSGNGRLTIAREVACQFLTKARHISTASLSEQHPKRWKGVGYISGTTHNLAGHTSGAAN